MRTFHLHVYKSLIFFGAEFCKPTIKKRSCWNCCCTIFYLKEQLFSCSSIKINKENVPREHSHNQNVWCFGLQLFASKKMTSQDITKPSLSSKIKIRETHFIVRILMCGFTKNWVLGEEFDKIQASIFVTEEGIVQAYF